jgi:aryl carrier-like protein
MLAGDWIPLTLPAEIRAAFPRARVLNLGGATETSVWSNAYEIEAVDPRWPSVPYGRPIANARYHVVDAHLAPCPIGVTGDMLIGGEILSLGYIGRPEATAERFLPDPFAEQPGSRLWLTGDRGRYGADGNLEFLGRVDHQVKVRGYRIELGEIEVALSRHPGIREAVVLAREDVPGEQRLVAYVVPAAAAAEPAEGDGAGRVDALRAFLLASLPEPMVPWDFIAMERLPVTANGKLDRAALPAPRDARGAAAPAYVAPRNELERAIGAAWREVLGVERIGVRESFFQAGGSSLLMARLQSRLRQTLARDIPFVELFKHPTIESLARSLGEPANLAAEAAGPAPGPQSRPAERARLRRESMRQVQQGGRRPRGGRGQRHE